MTTHRSDQAERARTTPRAVTRADYETVIVGAGFGGMGAAIELDRLGLGDFLIVDREDDVGGTWHVNRYPGLAVDIASTTYSYSFEPNPGWSHLYAPGAELKAYACHVANKYDLRRRMRLGTSVAKVVFDEREDLWTIHLEGASPIRARFLVLATGFLSQPKRPEIRGLDGFAGKVIHTARWDDAHPLEGKRAAVIGTGATAVQLLPEIAPRLAHLDVYQRTPIWVSPKANPAIPERVRSLFAAVPLTQRLARYATSSLLELGMVTAALHHRELPALGRGAEAFCRAHLHRQITDPVLREKLTPRYSFGCKRPTFSNDYYPTFLRPNVELVTDAIDHVAPEGIVTVDGRIRPIDTLILATGYKVWEKGNFPAFDVIGRDGEELGASWNRNGYQSYEGISVHGFPNLFYLASPYAFTGLSYFFTIEGQMKHIARCLGELRRRGATRFEPSAAAQAAFVRRMHERSASSVFVDGHCGPANSYYFNQHGEASLLRLSSTVEALYQAGHFPLDDYAFGRVAP